MPEGNRAAPTVGTELRGPPGRLSNCHSSSSRWMPKIATPTPNQLPYRSRRTKMLRSPRSRKYPTGSKARRAPNRGAQIGNGTSMSATFGNHGTGVVWVLWPPTRIRNDKRARLRKTRPVGGGWQHRSREVASTSTGRSPPRRRDSRRSPRCAHGDHPRTTHPTHAASSWRKATGGAAARTKGTPSTSTFCAGRATPSPCPPSRARSSAYAC